MANRERAKEIYDERFCRMWEFYLSGSEAAFRWQDMMVFQIQLTHRNDTLPLTRGYMEKCEKALAMHEIAHQPAAAEGEKPKRAGARSASANRRIDDDRLSCSAPPVRARRRSPKPSRREAMRGSMSSISTGSAFLPSQQMIADYGSPAAWQRAKTFDWMFRLARHGRPWTPRPVRGSDAVSRSCRQPSRPPA